MNKNFNFLAVFGLVVGLLFLVPAGLKAQTCDATGQNYIDANGDGFNDNAPDHDGDGIPNGLDEDYIKNRQDGTGYMKGEARVNRNAQANQFQAGEGDQYQHQVAGKFQEGEIITNQSGIANQIEYRNKGENKEAFKNQLRQFERDGALNQKRLCPRDGSGAGPGTGATGASRPGCQRQGQQ